MTAPRQNKPWWPPSPEFLAGARNLALFVIGSIGIFHETFVVSAAEPQLLILFAAMMGLPFVRWGDK